jgi:energy-coupling factor transport system ATP-binding protein
MDIALEQVEYRYSAGTPFEKLALEDLNLLLPSEKYTAIIGHTGSGKSTLLQHLNALLKPTSGRVVIGDVEITPKKKNKLLKPIRKRVGIVFQFPEHQLFEETVMKDICYGPLNFGISQVEAETRAKSLMETVGLDEEVLERSPFDLSGGQKRRVAIAGVLAMEPDVLVLDEPTAGLDPRGRTEIMDMFHRIHQEKGLTTVLVTHSMEDAAQYADEIVIMQKGKLVGKGSPEEIFSQPEWLFSLGLDVPDVVKFQYRIEQRLGYKFDRTCLTIEELASEVGAYMKRGGLS